jgi:hypothetical protein
MLVVPETFESLQNKCVIVLHSDLLSWVVHHCEPPIFIHELNIQYSIFNNQFQLER